MGPAGTRERVSTLFERVGSLTGAVGAGVDPVLVLDDLRDALVDLRALQAELSSEEGELAAARAALEAERQRYVELFQFAPDASFVTDVRGTIREANRAAERLLTARGPQLVGKPLELFVAPRRRKQLELLVDRVVRSGSPRMEWEGEMQPRGGLVFAASVSVGAIGDAGRTVGLRWIVRDVQARREADERLELALAELRRVDEERRGLVARLMRAEEAERARVARELHDELGQILTSLSLFARRIEQTSEGSAAEGLAEFRRQVEEAIVATRGLAWSLRPLELDELGLQAALRSLAERLGERHGLSIAAEVDGVGRFTAEIETALYRVVQEALTNIVKHASARSARIRLERRSGEVLATVEDDGIGFDAASMGTARRDRRLGLAGMQERVELLGGKLSIHSLPGRGTDVRARLPLPAVESEGHR